MSIIKILKCTGLALPSTYWFGLNVNSQRLPAQTDSGVATVLLVFQLLLFSSVCWGQTVAPVEDASATPAPDHLPDGWRAQLMAEPVLGSKVYVVTAGNPSNPPLVLMHGLGQNGWTDWRPLMKTLAEDYFILTLDFPGFGRSSIPRGRLSPKQFAAVTHWLVRQHDLSDVHLVGHSMGGAVALYYAAHYPTTLQRLTLIDVAGVLHRAAFVKSMADVAPESFDYLPTPIQRKAARLINLGDRLVENINLLPDITAPIHDSDFAWNTLLGNLPNTNAALSLVHTDYSYVLEAVNTPTSVIWGSEDPIAPLRSAYLLHEKLDHAQLAVIEGAEHVPIKSHTARVAELMLRPIQTPTTTPPAHRPGEQDLICRGETSTSYSGTYGRIVLDNCLGITLTNVTARQLELKDSIVEITDLRIEGASGTGLSLHNSAARITNGTIRGATAARLSGSRLDIAGVALHGSETALRVNGESVIVASVSEFKSPHYQGKAHGAVRAHNSVGERLLELQSNSEPVTVESHATQWQTP